jgi:hypothetical protein
MTTYPIEFHRRLEQKWASRIEQILTVTGTAPPPEHTAMGCVFSGGERRTP